MIWKRISSTKMETLKNLKLELKNLKDIFKMITCNLWLFQGLKMKVQVCTNKLKEHIKDTKTNTMNLQ